MTELTLLVAGVVESTPAPGNPFLSEGVLSVLITTVGGILTLLLGKLSFDLARVKKSSAKTHQLSAKVENSINNRDTPLSDRLDAVMEAVGKAVKAVEGVAATQVEQGEKLNHIKLEQQDQGRDIRGLRKDDGLLRGEVREVRENLSDHLSTTEESMSLIRRIAPHISKMESCPGSKHEQN